MKTIATNSDSSCGNSPVLASIILCGGQSRRMGMDKACVPWGDETLLQCSCRLVSKVASVLAVVAARSQQLPVLADGVTVVRDDYCSAGPLGGFLTGLSSLKRSLSADWDNCCVSLSACDSPFLNPRIVSAMHVTLLQNPEMFDCHVVDHQQILQPLHAVYRTRIFAPAQQLFDSGERSLQKLLGSLCVLSTPSPQFSELDPDLRFLRNVNTPEELAAAEQLLTEPHNRSVDGEQAHRT